MIPPKSTIRKRMDAKIYFPNSGAGMSTSLSKLLSMSRMNQLNSGMFIECTIKDVLEEILKKIRNSKEYKNFHENIKEFAVAKCLEKNKDKDKFEDAHKFINNLIGDYVTQKSKDWITGPWITSNIVFTEKQADEWIECSGGIPERIPPHVLVDLTRFCDCIRIHQHTF